MLDHGKRFGVPHRCLDCKSLVTVDVLHRLECPECGSARMQSYATSCKPLPQGLLARMRYGRLSDVELRHRGFYRQESELVGAAEGVILDTEHTCPACEAKAFRFELGDCYD